MQEIFSQNTINFLFLFPFSVPPFITLMSSLVHCLSQRNGSLPSDGSVFEFTAKFVDKYVDCDSLI